MGYHDRWSTKADMLKDLAEMTGGRIEDIDDNFIARDGKPPPRRMYEEDDDEMNLRYAEQDLHEALDMTAGPDLQGITNFLRMVSDFNDPAEDSVDCTRVADSEQIVISKLNPDVPEFVPGTGSSSDKDSKVDNEKTTFKKRNRTNDDEKTNGDKGDRINDTEIKMDKRIDISQLNADEIRVITTKLRNKISDASKQDNLQRRKEKNVAIATLLKLYSATPGTKSPQLNGQFNQIKLLTPEHFEKSPAVDLKADSNEDTSKPTDSIEYTNKPKKINDSIEISTSSKDDLSQTSSPKLEVDTTPNKKEYLNPDIQESINKVNKWFEKPTSPKPKGPVVCLGPPSFKRKAPTSTRSPPSEADSSRSTPSSGAPQIKIAQYKPSKYADDLSKKFSQQGKALEMHNKDMWTRLQDEMKIKDMEIKEKLKAKQSQEDSDSSHSKHES